METETGRNWEWCVFSIWLENDPSVYYEKSFSSVTKCAHFAWFRLTSLIISVSFFFCSSMRERKKCIRDFLFGFFGFCCEMPSNSQLALKAISIPMFTVRMPEFSTSNKTCNVNMCSGYLVSFYRVIGAHYKTLTRSYITLRFFGRALDHGYTKLNWPI